MEGGFCFTSFGALNEAALRPLLKQATAMTAGEGSRNQDVTVEIRSEELRIYHVTSVRQLEELIVKNGCEWTVITQVERQAPLEISGASFCGVLPIGKFRTVPEGYEKFVAGVCLLMTAINSSPENQKLALEDFRNAARALVGVRQPLNGHAEEFADACGWSRK